MNSSEKNLPLLKKKKNVLKSQQFPVTQLSKIDKQNILWEM